MKKANKKFSNNISELGISFLTMVIFLIIWEIVSRSGYYNINLFPPPSIVFSTFLSMLSSGELLLDSLMSLQRVAIGFCIGSLIGIFLGILTGRIRIISQTFGQIIQLLRPIPVIAFVPFAIIWLGLGESSKYFIISWGVFFPMWINTHIGVSSVDKTLIWAAKNLGASDRQVLYEVILPYAVRYIIAGARVGIAIAFICLVAAEMAGSFGGIGYRISASHLVFRVDKMMVGLAILGILGALSDALFIKLIRKIMPWAKV